MIKPSPARSPEKTEAGQGAKLRIIQGVLAVLLVATAATPVFAGTPHHVRAAGHHEQQELDAAGKRGKRKTVVKTFSSGQAIAIPAEDAVDEFGPADPYPSTIAVSGFQKGKITDVNLTLRGLSHTFTRNVDVLLVDPDGRTAFVMGDIGGSGEFSDATNLTLTFDDEATRLLPEGGAESLTGGTFQPMDPSQIDNGDADLEEFPPPAPTPSGDTALSTFDESDPNGLWRLFIIDDFDDDTGVLSDGWTLTIKATAKVKSKTKNKKKRNGQPRR